MVQMLAMALHELATNASKYGALKDPAARLEISWRLLEPGDEQQRLEIIWHEHNVQMPANGGDVQRRGQGRELIERALPYQLDAETNYHLGTDGLVCTLTIPISRTMP
jgi:two-component system CheB/CheR fusion protein